MGKHALYRFRTEVYPKFRKGLSQADIDFIENVIFMGPVIVGNKTAFFIDSLCDTEETSAKDAAGTSNILLTTDMLGLVLDTLDVRAIGSDDKVATIGNLIDAVLKSKIFDPISKHLDAVKSTSVLRTKIVVASMAADAMAAINTGITANMKETSMAIPVQRKALFYMIDAYLDMCYGMLTSVEVLSGLVMSQAFATTSRFVHLAQAYTYFYTEPKSFDDLELACRLSDLTNRVEVLGKVSVRTETDNTASAAMVRQASLDLQHVKKMDVNLTRDKASFTEEMERQRYLVTIETWIFLILLKICIAFLLFIGYFDVSTNVAVISVICIALVWLLSLECINMMQQRKNSP